MKRPTRGPALLIVLAAGCGAGDGPSSPAPPSAVQPEPAPEAGRLIPMGFGGPLVQPDTPLRLEPGMRITVPVMTAFGEFGNVDGTPGVLIRVITDAPRTALTVSEEVAVLSYREPGLAEIHALPGAAGRPTETWSVWLAEHPEQRWAPGWGVDLDQRRLRLTVAEAEPSPPPCELLELTGRVAPGTRDGGVRASLTFGRLADDFRAGTITLRTDHPDASLSLLSAYRMPYEDLDLESDRARVRFNPYPTTFAFELGFRETTAGIEQTLTLGWFDGLHLRAEAPGCYPVQLSCEDDGRCTPSSPAP